MIAYLLESIIEFEVVPQQFMIKMRDKENILNIQHLNFAANEIIKKNCYLIDHENVEIDHENVGSEGKYLYCVNTIEL